MKINLTKCQAKATITAPNPASAFERGDKFKST
jgi:hypothetical protein